MENEKRKLQISFLENNHDEKAGLYIGGRNYFMMYVQGKVKVTRPEHLEVQKLWQMENKAKSTLDVFSEWCHWILLAFI